jgi:MoxR-like ATPase
MKKDVPMKPSLVAKSLETLIQINQPVFVWGPAGAGKSRVVAQIAERIGYQMQDVRVILLDPVDLRGLPVAKNGRSYWAPPSFLPTEGKGILFLDELNAAPQLVQASCFQLILDRALGEYRLPEGWSIVAAGNRETDRAVVHRMPSPLANRFVHLEFEVDLDDWVAWALNAGIQTEVIAFLRFRPALLHSFDPRKNDKAFPTPRAWEFVSRVLAASPAKDIEYELLQGTVGEGAAAELLGFLRIFRNLPNPDLVLMNPQSVDIPTDPATLYALCGALSRKASDNNMERLVKFANRLPAEFSVLLIRDSLRRDKTLASTRAFIEWASAHSNVLI